MAEIEPKADNPITESKPAAVTEKKTTPAKKPVPELKPLVDNGDGTITDPNSELIWKKTDAWLDTHKFYTWQAHRDYVDEINKEKFDVITCLEMLEHVPDPSSIIDKCAALIKPGGTIFFSTINRNPKSFLFAIIGAEYILNLLPKGTHEYNKFITPAELRDWCLMKQLDFKSIIGMSYNPFLQEYKLGDDTSVNYIVEVKW